MVAFFAVTFTSCSSFMMVVLSVDCYLGLRRDVASGSMRNAFTVSVVVWLLAGTLNCIIPYVRVQQLVKFDCSDLEFAYCVEKWPHGIDLQAYRCVCVMCACVCARVFARTVGAAPPVCEYFAEVSCVCLCVRACVCARGCVCIVTHSLLHSTYSLHSSHNPHSSNTAMLQTPKYSLSNVEYNTTEVVRVVTPGTDPSQ